MFIHAMLNPFVITPDSNFPGDFSIWNNFNKRFYIHGRYITKQFFWDKGYDVSNLFIKHVSFENYYKSGEFEKDGIEAILLSGCLATFNEENWAKEQEHNQVKILTKSLKNVKLFTMIKIKDTEQNNIEKLLCVLD